MQSLRNRLARSYARAHRGMTLLEIMIVLAIIALVMALLVGPRVIKMLGDSKVKITNMKLKQYAFEAFPSWASSNPDKACPEKLSDLNAYMNATDSNDAWGRPLKLLCGQSLPAGVKGIEVISAGPDNKEGNEDDLRSSAQ